MAVVLQGGAAGGGAAIGKQRRYYQVEAVPLWLARWCYHQSVAELQESDGATIRS